MNESSENDWIYFRNPHDARNGTAIACLSARGLLPYERIGRRHCACGRPHPWPPLRFAEREN
jgi:hypothetical protein